MKAISQSLAIWALLGCSLVFGELIDTPKQYLITKPAKPVVIDGKLGEWDLDSSPYTITAAGKDPMNRVFSNEPTNPVKGDEDLRGRAALAWDEQYLYVAGRMIDDHLRGVKPDSYGNQGPPGWGCDSLMVAIASFRQPMKTNSPFSPHPFLGLRYAPMGENPRGKFATDERKLNKRDLYWVLTKNSKWAVAETEKGYNVEAAIPWKDLEFTARSGERVFVAFLAADIDPEEALNQVGWGFSGQPKDHPMHRLVDRAEKCGTITLSSDEVATDVPWAARVELEAHKGASKLAKVRVVDAKANAALERELSLETPEGKTGIELVEFAAGSVAKVGQYTVEALASAGGEAVVVAQVPLKIVEPQPEPPMIQNLPGEIRHMGPDRVALHAWWEHRSRLVKHGFVKGKEDYVPYIRRHVEPGLKDGMRNAIRTKSKWGFTKVFGAMALYQLDGDEEYAVLARDTIDYTLDLLKENLYWYQLHGVSRYRYLTWKNDPKSPFTPKDAEKRYREAFHRMAEKPGKEMFNESGTHNRVWHRYVIVLIARMIAEEDGKPIDPRIIEYTDYHKPLIHDVGDADDASAGYHWVFWAHASSLHFHTGDWDAFLKNKGFQKTLLRYVEMVSPSGACPQFQSCSGWHEVGASMWAYEWMSRITRDGRYRWTSHRIAEYYYNHLNHRASQYHLPYDTARGNFVMAYLLADASVPPKPAPHNSRITWRHPFVPTSLEKMRERPGTARSHLVPDEWIPDKVVLSSSNRPQDLWALVELLPAAGHGGSVPGNFIALMVHDAALLAGQGYYENTPDFQNLLWIEDLDGLAADPRPMETEVPILVEDPAFTFVRIQTTPYQHLPVTYTRDILFYKNGFVLVKDRAKFDSTMKVRLGPCYQTRCLGPQCGPHWFNAYYDQLYYTGLGLGRGCQAIRNPSWDLMVYFTPREGRKHTVLDRYLENPYRTSPIQVRQVWSGMVRAGQEITFTSVLLPHVPTLKPKHLLEPPADSKDPKRIEVAHDDDDLTVVKVISEMDPVNKHRREAWVMLNETATLKKAGPLESEGLVAVIGHHYNGKINSRAVVRGQVLRYRGNDESAGARKHEPKSVKLPADYREARKEF